MSDFDSLREDVAAMSESFAHYHTAVNRNTETLGRELNKLWDDNAAIRDDLHAVANRLEALTAFVTSNPAEVAARIVNDANRTTLSEVVAEVFHCPSCAIPHPHVHKQEGIVYT